MIRQLTFEEFVDLVGFPPGEVDWLRERFYAVEVDPVYGIVTLRHTHPACSCKGTLHWRLQDFQIIAEDASMLPAFHEMIDDACDYYFAEHTKEGPHQ